MAKSPAIMLFRRDLRLADNRALAAAIAMEGPVLPVFVLDDDTPGRRRAGGAARWWLHHSLANLAADLSEIGSRLTLRRGPVGDAIADLVASTGATSVHCTRSYEPWARAQENDLHARLSAAGIAFKRHRGHLLFEPDEVRTKTGDPYKVYTPFWRAVSSAAPPRVPLPAPSTLSAPTKWPASMKLSEFALLPTKPDWATGFTSLWQPGEAGAKAMLDRFLAGPMKAYVEDRNRPDRDGTSRLSPHLAHGEISPSHCWHATISASGGEVAEKSGAETFLKELVWREFSYHLLFNWPTLPDQPFKSEFGRFPWSSNPAALKAWQRGRTGIPIVDAGMRQLWTTGWMHNRVRMIVASFLVKNLLIPWQDGEQWFWDTLVDADLASNAASWQWVAGSGADAAPYFRIFNPVKQGETYDPQGDYIRAWVPELARLPAPAIFAPWTAPAAVLRSAGIALGDTYPMPIADLAASREAALAAFATLKA